MSKYKEWNVDSFAGTVNHRKAYCLMKGATRMIYENRDTREPWPPWVESDGITPIPNPIAN
jgi:hypothetical protein